MRLRSAPVFRESASRRELVTSEECLNQRLHALCRDLKTPACVVAMPVLKEQESCVQCRKGAVELAFDAWRTHGIDFAAAEIKHSPDRIESLAFSIQGCSGPGRSPDPASGSGRFSVVSSGRHGTSRIGGGSGGVSVELGSPATRPCLVASPEAEARRACATEALVCRSRGAVLCSRWVRGFRRCRRRRRRRVWVDGCARSLPKGAPGHDRGPARCTRG